MPAKTKYSRNTWKKTQLRQNMNTPKYGDGACQLCENGDQPDLYKHVSTHKTCGDVHLELSLLTKYQATCAAGQTNYRDFCCPKQKNTNIGKLPVTVFAGIFLVWIVRHCKLLRRRRIQCVDDDNDEESDRGSKASHYRRMKDKGSKDEGSLKKSKKKEKPNIPPSIQALNVKKKFVPMSMDDVLQQQKEGVLPAIRALKDKKKNKKKKVNHKSKDPESEDESTVWDGSLIADMSTMAQITQVV